MCLKGWSATGYKLRIVRPCGTESGIGIGWNRLEQIGSDWNTMNMIWYWNILEDDWKTIGTDWKTIGTDWNRLEPDEHDLVSKHIGADLVLE
jgi:hypothetical protein